MKIHHTCPNCATTWSTDETTDETFEQYYVLFWLDADGDNAHAKYSFDELEGAVITRIKQGAKRDSFLCYALGERIDVAYEEKIKFTAENGARLS